MSKIKRSDAIDLVINGIVNRIVKASEVGDFSELKSILLHSSEGVVNMNNKELAAALKESTDIDYEVLDEDIKYPKV